MYIIRLKLTPLLKSRDWLKKIGIERLYIRLKTNFSIGLSLSLSLVLFINACNIRNMIMLASFLLTLQQERA